MLKIDITPLCDKRRESERVSVGCELVRILSSAFNSIIIREVNCECALARLDSTRHNALHFNNSNLNDVADVFRILISIMNLFRASFFNGAVFIPAFSLSFWAFLFILYERASERARDRHHWRCIFQFKKRHLLPFFVCWIRVAKSNALFLLNSIRIQWQSIDNLFKCSFYFIFLSVRCFHCNIIIIIIYSWTLCVICVFFVASVNISVIHIFTFNALNTMSCSSAKSQKYATIVIWIANILELVFHSIHLFGCRSLDMFIQFT